MTDLINTLDTPGEFDALAHIRPDEPYFLLLGRDRFAPDLVAQWANLNRRRALVRCEDEATLERELRKSTEAEMIGCGMKAYKAGYAVDPATVRPISTLPTGVDLPEETVKRDREQAARSRSVRALHNAVAELNDAADTFRDLGLRGIAEDVELMKDSAALFAEALTPKRPGMAA